ncbi:MAG: carbohydrate binding family 9 domain-containing protein [Opitutae bacterium]|nr:carbohydrate binding family 9 domain-containing protein [Opitutae bacterium]MBT7854724.1 carbohydrate binding family 9 domain-containing protein [Opitutae bacterium]
MIPCSQKAFVILLMASALGIPTLAEDRHALVIPRIQKAPTIDGKLDDDCWIKASVAKDFRQRHPEEGAPATEKTEVKICRDDRALYIAARCFDSQPDKIRAGVMQRDAAVKGDDYFFILLDPFQRSREGYYFRTNANGAKGEALISSDMRKPNMDWDTIWEVRSQRDELGWTAEFAIPFRSIPFDPNSDEWRIDFGRWFARNQERSRWVGFNRSRRWFSLEEAGRMEGLLGAESGKGIDFKPYVSNKWASGDSSDGNEFDTGFDLFYRVTPSLTATLTYNTDFAETEVDQRKVNLSRFPLFYPEKRDFFLEGAEQFTFGGLSESPLAFHSRTIGLSPEGKKIDVVGGAKITGRQGRIGIGMLGMGLDERGDINADEVFAGRFTYDLMEESKIGAIFTHGDPQANIENNLVGVDLNLRASEWWHGQSVVFHSFYMKTHDGETGSDDVMGAWFSLPNYPFRMGGHWVRTGENFEPALGFVRRRGGQSSSIRFAYAFDKPGSATLDDITVGAEYTRYDLLSGGIDTEEIELNLIEVQTLEGDHFGLTVEFEREVLTETFEIVDGVNLAANDYRGSEIELEYGSSTKRPMFGEIKLEYGDYYDGKAFRGRTRISWRPSRHAQIDVGGGLTSADLSDDEFDVWTGNLGIRITPSTRLSFNSIIQYDNQSEQLGLNNRLRYILKPGRDVYVVFNKGYDHMDDKFRSFQTETITKLGWTFQF